MYWACSSIPTWGSAAITHVRRPGCSSTACKQSGSGYWFHLPRGPPCLQSQGMTSCPTFPPASPPCYAPGVNGEDHPSCTLPHCYHRALHNPLHASGPWCLLPLSEALSTVLKWGPDRGRHPMSAFFYLECRVLSFLPISLKTFM